VRRVIVFFCYRRQIETELIRERCAARRGNGETWGTTHTHTHTHTRDGGGGDCVESASSSLTALSRLHCDDDDDDNDDAGNSLKIALMLDGRRCGSSGIGFYCLYLTFCLNTQI